MQQAVRSWGGAAAARQRGRSVVELAVVLVVFGLILGGILKGHELVADARLKATLVDIETVRAAAATFGERYGSLPGDYALAQDELGTPNGVVWDCRAAMAPVAGVTATGSSRATVGTRRPCCSGSTSCWPS